MKRSLIHRGFYREILRQLRTRGLVSTFILAGINLIVFAVLATRDPLKSTASHVDPRLMAFPMMAFLYVMGPIMVFGGYRWLVRRAQSDFYHAIPLSRTQLYATTSLAIFTWMFIALSSYAIVQASLFAIFGLPFNYLLFFCVFLNMLIAAIEIVAAFSLASALCGSRFCAFFSSAVILFMPRALLAAFWVLVEVDSGLTRPFSALPFFLNPSFNIAATPFHSLVYGANFANVWAMLYSFVYACGLLLLGGIAFRRRKSEDADIPYTSKFLQAFTRIAFGLPQLALIVVAFNIMVRYGNDDIINTNSILLPLTVASLFFSFIFYCLYELISSKKMKAVVKAMPLYGAVVGIALFLIFVPVSVGRLIGIKPIDSDSIRSYRINNEPTLIMPYNIDGAETYTNYLLHSHTFTDESGKNKIAERTREDTYDGLSFDSELLLVNTGGLLPKAVGMPWQFDDYDKMLENALKDPAFAERFYAYPEGTVYCFCEGVTARETKEIAQLFREDFEKLTNEQKISLKTLPYENSFNLYSYSTDLTIQMYGCKGTKNYTMSYRITELTPKAMQRYLSLLNERNGRKAKDVLNRCVEWMETGDGTSDSLEFRLFNTYIDPRSVYFSDEGYQYLLPKESDPALYTIVKALSESPLSTDPNSCVTMRVENPNPRSSSTYLPLVGIECSDELRDQILTYLENNQKYR